MDQVKNGRPRRRLKWLGLPAHLRDRALARMLERPRRCNVRVIDIAAAREQGARRVAIERGGAA